MANKNRKYGLVPQGDVRSKNYYVTNAAVYPGDAVKMDSSGLVGPVSAGDAILGVALQYASATGTRILVSDHPEQRYVINANGADIDAQTDVGNNADLTATAGNSAYKLSRMELDTATLATSSAQVTILDIDQRPDNAFGADVDVVVRINEHQIAKDAFAGI